ncbi:hypothetical protein PILCRDRAFT_827485, partial [Piloderma croceum F 1598]
MMASITIAAYGRPMVILVQIAFCSIVLICTDTEAQKCDGVNTCIQESCRKAKKRYPVSS